MKWNQKPLQGVHKQCIVGQENDEGIDTRFERVSLIT